MHVVADWEAEASYPANAEDFPSERWHWEFLRRSPRYQQDHDRFAATGDARLSRKYAMEGPLPDYRDDLATLFRSPRDRTKVRLVRYETQWREDEDGGRTEETVERPALPPLRPHQCCVVFDLRGPVEAQIATARRRLERERRRAEEKRGRAERYPLYLRLLDAEAVGVAVEVMAEALFPDEDPRIRERRTKLDLDEARRLRDGGYRYI